MTIAMRHSLSLLMLVCALTLGSCTSLELISQFSKQRPSADQNLPISDNGTRYKIGLPYRIKGITYYPKVDYDYEEIGSASWYGEAFHGKKTANGALFDMHAVSAAHRTLPLPSLVEVENLDNGRKLIVKVNDRGPFHGNRILDLSMRAAELLGFKNKGVTRVRVRILAEESRRLAVLMQNKKTPKTPQSSSKDIASLTRVSNGVKAPSAEVVTTPLRKLQDAQTSAESYIPPRNGVYVQVAAFSEIQNALLIRRKLANFESTIGLAPHPNGNGGPLYKVLVGPFTDTAAAARARQRLLQQNFPGAHLITWRS